ncbi:MAG: hypothetical protein J6B39_07665, partial [Lachnospiraceae bacterium]|nr:hypothetical protein [Lachnospiraceae bacterium]
GSINATEDGFDDESEESDYETDSYYDDEADTYENDIVNEAGAEQAAARVELAGTGMMYDIDSDEADNMETEPETEAGSKSGYDYEDAYLNQQLTKKGRYQLKREERYYLDKYLYREEMEKALTLYMGSVRNSVPDGTSVKGNIAISGNKDCDKTDFALSLIRAIHAYDEKRNYRVIRIKAEAINDVSINTIKPDLAGQILLIENAHLLSSERVNELIAFMNSYTKGMLVVLTDEEFNISKLFSEYPEFGKLFTGKFIMKKYVHYELVMMAQEYAKENGWIINDKALLELYLLVGKIDSSNQGNVVKTVKELVDAAAAKAEKRLINKTFGRMRAATVINKKDFDGSKL